MKRFKTKKCDKCEREITMPNYKKHINSCGIEKRKKTYDISKLKQVDGKYQCPYCKNLFVKYGIAIHIHLKHSENKEEFYKNRKDTSWNRGLTKETDKRVKKNGEQISKSLLVNHPLKNKTHSQETKDKLSKIAKQRGIGGRTYRKRYKYTMICGKEVYMDSSYEVKVAEELDKHNIRWERPTPMKWIDENDAEHKYHADFYLFDYDTYLDPKNDYLIKKDKYKISRASTQNNVTIIVLSKRELEWNVILDKIKTTK